MSVELGTAIVLLDNIFKLVAVGMRFDDLYKRVKEKYEAGATEQEITDYLNSLMASSDSEAQAAIDAARLGGGSGDEVGT